MVTVIRGWGSRKEKKNCKPNQLCPSQCRRRCLATLPTREHRKMPLDRQQKLLAAALEFFSPLKPWAKESAVRSCKSLNSKLRSFPLFFSPLALALHRGKESQAAKIVEITRAGVCLVVLTNQPLARHSSRSARHLWTRVRSQIGRRSLHLQWGSLARCCIAAHSTPLLRLTRSPSASSSFDAHSISELALALALASTSFCLDALPPGCPLQRISNFFSARTRSSHHGSST